MYVYLITNAVNGKIYVGQHKGDNLVQYLQKKFWAAQHKPKERSSLFAAIRKHGRENFSIEPIAEVHGDMPKAVLNSLETFCIAFLDSRNHEKGYNICRGGEGFTGPHSEEAKKKNAAASRLMWQRPGVKENFSAKMKGHATSSETIEKIKSARAKQDESVRLEAFNEWKNQKLAVDPDHFKKIGGAASREDKARAGRAGSREDKQRAGRIAAKSLPKAIHTRWHVNRGKTNPERSLCGS